MDGSVDNFNSAVLQQAMSPEFWINLNPHMSVSSSLGVNGQDQYYINPGIIDSSIKSLSSDGYLRTDPVVPLQLCSMLGKVVNRVVEEGFPPPFVMIYDEFWKLLWRFDELLKPILGTDYRILPDFWVWQIDNDGQSSGWSPHRDHEWSDRKTIRDDGRPLLMTVWIPLSDATTQSSCIYVLPTSKDPHYPDNLSVTTVPEIVQQYSIPLSVTAGSILGWNQFIIHWGGQMGINAQGPRISLGIYYQSGDVDEFNPFMLRRTDDLTFEYRLGVISRMIIKYKNLGISPGLLRFCEMNSILLENIIN